MNDGEEPGAIDALQREYLVSLYDDRLARYGDRPEAVGWSPEGQRRHYEALLKAGPLAGKSILDFGCGKGDFLGFLHSRGVDVDYRGVDINAGLVDLALRTSPGADFRVVSGVEEVEGGPFDFIFLCGVFNVRIEGIERIIERTIEPLFARCRGTLVFDALADTDPRKDFALHYCDPARLLRFALDRLSPRASLHLDEIPHNLFLHVHRT